MKLVLSPRSAERLVKLLGMLGSNHDGERAAAAAKANELVRGHGLVWRDVIPTTPEPRSASYQQEHAKRWNDYAGADQNGDWRTMRDFCSKPCKPTVPWPMMAWPPPRQRSNPGWMTACKSPIRIFRMSRRRRRKRKRRNIRHAHLIGLLRKIGDRGLLVIKDVTSILSADRNTRAGVLAALREIYDGRWERNVGTDGGMSLTWTGRIAVVGAVTTAWDAAHAVISVMGDRFVSIRSNSTVGRSKAGRQAIKNTGSEITMRAELAAAVGGLIAHIATDQTWQIDDNEIERLIKAADIVTYARTAVERDFRGDIIDSHAPEMPTRFAKQLAQMVRGGLALGMSRGTALQLALRCARDSIPQLRLEILLELASNPRSRVIDVVRNIAKPYRTIRRELKGLHILGLLRCDEEQTVTTGDETKTIWRYSLADGFDRATLLSMGGEQLL
jgi:hypothetical protein